jgi:hypothetical protein
MFAVFEGLPEPGRDVTFRHEFGRLGHELRRIGGFSTKEQAVRNSKVTTVPRLIKLRP